MIEASRNPGRQNGAETLVNPTPGRVFLKIEGPLFGMVLRGNQKETHHLKGNTPHFGKAPKGLQLTSIGTQPSSISQFAA